MTVKFQIAGEEVEAVVDTEASASVVGKCLAYKLGIWKRARKVTVKEEDRSILVGNFVVTTSFQAIDSSLVLNKFAIDAEVLDIGNGVVILVLS